MDKVEEAIARLISNEPVDGYFLAFSGGKCSVVIDDLARASRVNYTANYSQTGIDPPELVEFIKKEYPQVIWHKYLKTMWQGIEENGLPTRWRRWCCRYLKHHAGKGRTKITGIHRSESTARANFNVVERRGSSLSIQPIVDWEEKDVWDYIKTRELRSCLLYKEGFTRLGCVLCPLASKKVKKLEAERYPKFLEAYRRANLRYAKRKGFSEARANDYFNRWIGE